MPSGRPACADESPSGLPRAFRRSDDPPTVQRTSVGPMIQDVTGFQRAEMTCLWSDESVTPVRAWRAARRHTGGRDGAGICTSLGPRAAIECTGRRDQRVRVRRGASPAYAAKSVAPDQIPEADRGRPHLPGRRATAAATCAAPGSTRHQTAATLSIGELLARAAQRDPSAWEEIISRYNGVVCARVRSFRLQDADAVDAGRPRVFRIAVMGPDYAAICRLRCSS